MIALLVVLLYVLVLIGVGWHSSRKVSGSTDFLLAGRRLGPVILVGTLVATWTGPDRSSAMPRRLMAWACPAWCCRSPRCLAFSRS